MFKTFMLRFALFIIKFNLSILIRSSDDGLVIFCYCCDKHLKEGCLEVGNSPNPMQLTLDEDGQNREFNLLGMK